VIVLLLKETELLYLYANFTCNCIKFYLLIKFCVKSDVLRKADKINCAASMV